MRTRITTRLLREDDAFAETRVEVLAADASGEPVGFRDVTAQDWQTGCSGWVTTVSWSSVGAVTPADARAYAAAIIRAADIIEGVAEARQAAAQERAARERRLQERAEEAARSGTHDARS